MLSGKKLVCTPLAAFSVFTVALNKLAWRNTKRDVQNIRCVQAAHLCLARVTQSLPTPTKHSTLWMFTPRAHAYRWTPSGGLIRWRAVKICWASCLLSSDFSACKRPGRRLGQPLFRHTVRAKWHLAEWNGNALSRCTLLLLSANFLVVLSRGLKFGISTRAG